MKGFDMSKFTDGEKLFYQYKSAFDKHNKMADLAAKYNELSHDTLVEYRKLISRIKSLLEKKFAKLLGVDTIYLNYMSDELDHFNFRFGNETDVSYIDMCNCDVRDVLLNMVRIEKENKFTQNIYSIHRLSIGEQALKDI